VAWGGPCHPRIARSVSAARRADHVHAGIARVQLGPFVEPGLYVLRREERPVALFEPVVPAAECLVAPPIQPRSVARWVDPSDPPWPTSATREPASLLLAGALGLLLGKPG